MAADPKASGKKCRTISNDPIAVPVIGSYRMFSLNSWNQKALARIYRSSLEELTAWVDEQQLALHGSIAISPMMRAPAHDLHSPN